MIDAAIAPALGFVRFALRQVRAAVGTAHEFGGIGAGHLVATTATRGKRVSDEPDQDEERDDQKYKAAHARIMLRPAAARGNGRGERI